MSYNSSVTYSIRVLFFSPCLNKGLCQPSTLSSIFPWNISSFDQDLIFLTHRKRTVPLTWKIFKHFATKTGCWSSVFFIGVFMLIHQSQNIHNWFPFKRLFFYYVTLETSVWRGWQGTAKGKKPQMFGWSTVSSILEYCWYLLML